MSNISFSMYNRVVDTPKSGLVSKIPGIWNIAYTNLPLYIKLLWQKTLVVEGQEINMKGFVTHNDEIIATSFNHPEFGNAYLIKDCLGFVRATPSAIASPALNTNGYELVTANYCRGVNYIGVLRSSKEITPISDEYVNNTVPKSLAEIYEGTESEELLDYPAYVGSIVSIMLTTPEKRDLLQQAVRGYHENKNDLSYEL